ncbi:trp operon repressor [Patescibacteria group bacterium]|nr:trp operon repressor [Patescibacteria group bacterium]MBU1931119.1 trp operon repressor [Patescibacteria group bacterium]
MQISPKKLSRQQKKDIFKKLYQVLADLKKPDDIAAFLDNVLTPIEKTAIAKRLNIVFYLKKGKSYSFIKDNLGVSSATISSIQKEMENSPGFTLALETIETDEWASQWAQKITDLFKSFSLKKVQTPV